MRYSKTLNEMKDLSFKGLSEIDVASAMYFESHEFRSTPQLSSCIIKLIRTMFRFEVEKTIKNDTEVAIIYSNNYRNRMDHQQSIDKFKNIFSSYIFFGQAKSIISVQNIKYLALFFCWLFTFLKKYSFRESFDYALELYYSACNAFYIKKQIIKHKCKKIIVFSDMHPIDSLVVQMCNKVSLPTFTLQHGFFGLDEPFVLSKSRFFLCYGESTKELATNYGMNPKKLIKVGMLKYIDCLLPTSLAFCGEIVHSIGIVLSGDSFYNADVNMIHFLISYCEKRNLALKVKFHPGYGIEKYKEISWDNIESYERELTCDEFKRTVDLVIVYSSTVFLECLMEMIPVAIYDDHNNMYYKGVADQLRFYSEEELDIILEKMIGSREEFIKIIEHIRNYYSETKNIREKYYDAIINV